MRQQAITLIFLLVIEDIKVYHLGYLKVFALRKSQALFAKSYEASYSSIYPENKSKTIPFDREVDEYL